MGGPTEGLSETNFRSKRVSFQQGAVSCEREMNNPGVALVRALFSIPRRPVVRYSERSARVDSEALLKMDCRGAGTSGRSCPSCREAHYRPVVSFHKVLGASKRLEAQQIRL